MSQLFVCCVVLSLQLQFEFNKYWYFMFYFNVLTVGCIVHSVRLCYLDQFYCVPFRSKDLEQTNTAVAANLQLQRHFKSLAAAVNYSSFLQFQRVFSCSAFCVHRTTLLLWISYVQKICIPARGCQMFLISRAVGLSNLLAVAVNSTYQYAFLVFT